MSKPRIPLALYAPKYWVTWVGIIILRLLSFFPYKLMPKISSLLGLVLFKIVKRKRHIIETNMKICFPEKTAKEQHQLALQASAATFMALFETSMTWWGPPYKSYSKWERRDHFSKPFHHTRNCRCIFK